MNMINTYVKLNSSTKTMLFAVVFFAVNSSFAQDKFLTRNGEISFYSKAPVEDIESHSNKVLSIIDIKKSEVAVNLLMKSFEFEKKLMQEHFNENYIESDKFPKATFKGSYGTDENISAMVDGEYNVVAKGELSIHGVKKEISIPVKILIQNKKLSATLEFKVLVKDYDIKIPKVVVKNIAEEVTITAKFSYEPYK
jgi:YceI-like domain